MRLPAALFTLAAIVVAIIIMCFALAALKLPARLFGLAAIVLTIAGTWYGLKHTNRPRDPVAYYTSWGGYWHPIGLYNRITKEKADEWHAEGKAYMVGYYDDVGRLVRVVKYLKGEVFFEYSYTYHDNGRLKSARVVRGGRDTLLEYDERGQRPPGQRTAM